MRLAGHRSVLGRLLERRPWPLAALFLALLALLGLFGALAEDVWNREGFAWDAPVLLWLHGLASPALDRLMVGRTTFVVAHRLSTVRSASRTLLCRFFVSFLARSPNATFSNTVMCGQRAKS